MKTLLLFTALIGFSTSPAQAMGRGSGPCEPAMDDFCGGLLEFSHDAVMKCLKDHEEELTPACKEVVKTWKPAHTEQPGQADTSKKSDRS